MKLGGPTIVLEYNTAVNPTYGDEEAIQQIVRATLAARGRSIGFTIRPPTAHEDWWLISFDNHVIPEITVPIPIIEPIAREVAAKVNTALASVGL